MNIETEHRETPPFLAPTPKRRKEACIHGHARTPENINRYGACIECVRILNIKRNQRRRGTLQPGRMACLGCGHRAVLHEDGRECYHEGANGEFDCDCVKYQRRDIPAGME